MAKNPQHIYLVRTAHMHRKLETGKRHISAPRVSLENGTYLPPIYRTIALRLKRRREKEHRAYAHSVSLLTETGRRAHSHSRWRADFLPASLVTYSGAPPGERLGRQRIPCET